MTPTDKQPAPIVFIAFNRPAHTEQSLTALAENPLAKQSDLFVFIDGPRSSAEKKLNQQVIKVCEQAAGFQSVTVSAREKNVGLATNIPAAVSTVINRFGRAIVVEDDIFVSNAFLQYMNDALDYYETEKKVWHIAGHYKPLTPKMPANTSFFLPFMHCWGWATWKNRWQHYNNDTAGLMEQFSRQQRKDFLYYGFGIDGWQFLESCKKGSIQSWAIHWGAVIFLQGGLCLNPYYSLVRNIGCDGSGVHCGIDKQLSAQEINHDMLFTPPPKVAIDKKITEIIEKEGYLRKNIMIRRINRRANFIHSMKRRLSNLLFRPHMVIYRRLKRLYKKIS